MSTAGSGTLKLGLAQETLGKWTPWVGGGEGGDKARPGEAFGCDLTRLPSGKVHVSRIAEGGPAALSGLLAVGDEILAIDGTSLADWTESVSLHNLTAGEDGAAVWLEVAPAASPPPAQPDAAGGAREAPCRTVCVLMRQKPLDAKEWAWSDVSLKSALAWGAVSKLPGTSLQQPDTQPVSVPGLGIEIKLSPEGQVLVSSVAEGGAAWLSAQGRLADSGGLLAVGDVLTEVDGQSFDPAAATPAAPSTSAAAASLLKVAALASGTGGNKRLEKLARAAVLLQGADEKTGVFSRVCVTLERDGRSMTAKVVRAPVLKAKYLAAATEFQQRVASLPPVPPSERFKRREGRLSCPPLTHIRPAGKGEAWGMTAEEAAAVISAALPAPSAGPSGDPAVADAAFGGGRGASGAGGATGRQGATVAELRLFDVNLTDDERAAAAALLCAVLEAKMTKVDRIACMNETARMKQLRMQRAKLDSGKASNAGGGKRAEDGGAASSTGGAMAAPLSAVSSVVGKGGTALSSMGSWLTSAASKPMQKGADKLPDKKGEGAGIGKLDGGGSGEGGGGGGGGGGVGALTQQGWQQEFVQELFASLQISDQERAEVEASYSSHWGSTHALAAELVKLTRRGTAMDSCAQISAHSAAGDAGGASESGPATETGAEGGAETVAREGTETTMVTATEEEWKKDTSGQAATKGVAGAEAETAAGTAAETAAGTAATGTEPETADTGNGTLGEGEPAQGGMESEKAEWVLVEAARTAAVENEQALAEIERERRAVVGGVEWSLCWLLLSTAVQSARYDARARAALRRLTRQLGVPWQWLAAAEVFVCAQIVQRALDAAREQVAAAAHGAAGDKEKPQSVGKYQRWGYIGGGAVLGGLVFAVSGGLAVPAVVAGMGLCGAAVGAHVALGAGSVGALTTVVSVSFGGYGAGLVGQKVRCPARLFARGAGCGGAAYKLARAPSPTLSPTDPVPRGLLTLCPAASSGPQGR